MWWSRIRCFAVCSKLSVVSVVRIHMQPKQTCIHELMLMCYLPLNNCERKRQSLLHFFDIYFAFFCIDSCYVVFFPTAQQKFWQQNGKKLHLWGLEMASNSLTLLFRSLLNNQDFFTVTNMQEWIKWTIEPFATVSSGPSLQGRIEVISVLQGSTETWCLALWWSTEISKVLGRYFQTLLLFL